MENKNNFYATKEGLEKILEQLNEMDLTCKSLSCGLKEIEEKYANK